MSKKRVASQRKKRRRQSGAKVIPMFVCPGARIEPSELLIFPYGAGCSEIAPCPVRECCVWHCRHDLGRTAFVSDFPEAAILDVRYRSRPFSCRNYRDDERERRRSKLG